MKTWDSISATVYRALNILVMFATVVAVALVFTGSAGASTPVLHAGALTEHGTPVSGRVAVLAGGVQVASVTTDGDVAIPLAYSPALRSLASSNDGYVNLDFLAASSRWFESVSAPVRFVDGAWVFETQPVLEVTTGRDDASKAQAFVSGAGPACYTLPDGNPVNTYTTVGEIHTPGSGVSATLTYGKTADSDIGVGSNLGGAWHLSGTVHMGNSNAVSVSWTRGSDYGKRENSLFAYQKFHTIGNGCDYYTIKATTWGGGAADGSYNHGLDYHCDDLYNQWSVKYYGGTSFDRSSNNYITFSGAANPLGLIGVTAQSGSSTFVKWHYSFNQAQSQFRVICGINNFPTYTLRILAGCHGPCDLSPEAREVRP